MYSLNRVLLFLPRRYNKSYHLAELSIEEEKWENGSIRSFRELIYRRENKKFF